MMGEGVDEKFSQKYHDVSKSTKHPKTLTELKINRKKLKQSKSFSHFTTFSYLLLQLIIFSCAFLLNSSPLQASAISDNEVQDGTKIPLAIIDDGEVDEISPIDDLEDSEEEENEHNRQLRSTDHYLRSLRSSTNDHYLRSLRAAE